MKFSFVMEKLIIKIQVLFKVKIISKAGVHLFFPIEKETDGLKCM